MDPIAFTPPAPNPATFGRLYGQGKPAAEAKAESDKPSAPPDKAQPLAPASPAPAAFASQFDDQSLEQLQRNLESIATLAEQTLKRYQAGDR